MKGGTERRKYPRSKPEPGTSIAVTAGDGSDEPNLALRLIDVSAIGACVETPRPLAEGGEVRVELILPGPGGGRFSRRGTVRWAQSLEAGGARSHVAGLEFEPPVEALAGRAGESAVLDVLLTLRIAVAQLRLYPKDSPQVLKVLTDCYHSVHSYLTHAASLTLSRTERGLLVNGRPLPPAGTVSESLEAAALGLLSDAQVKSVTFSKGLTLEELGTFLHALTRKFWDVKDGKEINRRLRAERVLRVSVDEVTYVALGEGDLVIQDAARKLEGSKTELGRLLEGLDQLVEAAEQGGHGGEGRMLLVKRLLERDPGLLARVQGGPTGEGGAGEGGAAPGTGRISFEAARDALGDLARVLPSAPENLRPVLRRVGRTLADAFRHDPNLAALMEGLLEEVREERPAAVESGGSGAERRAGEILALAEDERIAAMAQEGPGLLDELAALGKPQAVQGLLEALSGSLADRSARRRQAAARALNGLRRALERHAPEEALEAVEVMARSALDGERDAQAYPALADLAGFLADLRLRRGRLERAREMVELLERHDKIRDPSFPQRGNFAYMALERLALGPGFAALSDRIRGGDAEASRLVEALGAAATRFLLGLMKQAESPAERMRLAGFIVRAGPGAAAVLLDELQKTAAPSDAVRMLEAIPHAMPADMAEMALVGLLRHPALMVRRRAAALAAEQGYPRAGAALLEAYHAEEEAGSRRALVECLGRVRYRGAVEDLAATAEGRTNPADLRVAACLALGKIGDARAVPVLARICLKGEKGITGILRSVPAEVRAAAVRALSLFPDDREAREALRRAQEDRDPQVRAAALQARVAPFFDAFGAAAEGVRVVASEREIDGVSGTFGGTLRDVPFAALCGRLAGLEQSGGLQVACGGSSGRIWFDAGLVIAAEFEGRRDAEAFAALADPRRSEGLFLFRGGEMPPERRVLLTVEGLFEGLRERGGGQGSSSRFV
ncbi:MAG TPA: HEAT repeat domain-containing protein [Planctomycetota bacterium]|nr:HEAT repeat domain-containing protein [Planctomycetota bacterium]